MMSAPAANDLAPSRLARQSPVNSKYRADIDGLRSVAVLSVLFFHVGLPAFSGGWVGVDVFFVISGFLITGLIAGQLEAGSFSFGKFYARRARRLFSSFIFTVALSFIVGSVVFDPVYRQHFAGEIVYTLAAASNFFYWLDGGYFGVAEGYKPLLHTWSLGVEEQFYLIWPLLVVLTLGYFRRYLWLLLSSAFLASLFLAEYYFYAGKENAVFFLLPFRIFEFAIGAMLVGLVRYQARHEWRLELALMLGLGLIFYSVFFFTKSTPFPTIYALIPCVGTGLAIFGGCAKRLKSILGNKPIVWIGKISYSLYLVHWPIIVFYRYHRLAPLNHLEQAAICAASVGLASLMYVFIEQPFRNPDRIKFSSKAALGLACSSTVLVLMVPASIIWAKGSFIWNVQSEVMRDSQVRQMEEQQQVDDLDNQLRDRSFGNAPGRPRFMFIGDSHSDDIEGALLLTLGTEGYEYARSGFDDPCFSSADTRPWILRIVGTKTICEAQIEALKGNKSLAAANYVFIANYWSEQTIVGFSAGLAFLRTLTKARIVLVGQNAAFPTFDKSLRFLGDAQLQTLNGQLFGQRSVVDERINERLRQLASVNGLGFIDRQSLICSEATSQCDVLAPNGKLLYRDVSHWSYEGRRVFGDLMVKKFGRLFLSPDRQ
jgi:peptidoglycan/LPS O-acetylase OafA/YrhL